MEKIENLEKGTFFKKKEGAKKTFIKKDYCRTNKGWECGSWDDISEFFYLKRGKQVFTNFDL